MNDQQICRVLLVSDTPELRRQLSTASSPAGPLFELDDLPPDLDALAHCRKARAAGRPYSVIFLDPGPVPSADFSKMLASLWAEEPDLQAVLCAGASDPAPAEMAGELPPSGRWLFLKKPYLPGESHQMANFLALTHRLEAQLRQSQKTESVGQLASGIAHDFNNLLTVISGHVGMLRAEKAASAEAADSLKEIAEASKRASDLTHQLLTLSRKPALRRQVADLNKTGTARHEEHVAGAVIPSAKPRDIGGTETILLVEDEPPLLKLMHHILESHGYKVLDASDGKAALEIWGQHQHKIELLLTDLVLPDGMTGYELAKVLQVEKPGLNVVYTSGYDSSRLSQGLTPAPEMHFIQKPFHTRKLLEMVFEALSKK